MTVNPFQEAIVKLNEVKKDAIAQAQEHADKATAQYNLRLAMEHLDTAFLFLREAGSFIMMHSELMDEAVAEASEQGTIKFPKTIDVPEK